VGGDEAGLIEAVGHLGGATVKLDMGSHFGEGEALRFPLPIAAAAHQQFLAAAAGWGGLDDSAVVKVYECLAGISVARKG